MNLYENILTIVTDIFTIKINQYIDTIYYIYSSRTNKQILLALWEIVTLTKSPRNNAIILDIFSEDKLNFTEMCEFISFNIFTIKIKEYQYKVSEEVGIDFLTLKNLWDSNADINNISMSVFDSVKWCIVKNPYIDIAKNISIGIKEHIMIAIPIGYKKPYKILKLWDERVFSLKTKADMYNNIYQLIAKTLCKEIIKYMITFKADVLLNNKLKIDYKNIVFPNTS